MSEKHCSRQNGKQISVTSQPHREKQSEDSIPDPARGILGSEVWNLSRLRGKQPWRIREIITRCWGCKKGAGQDEIKKAYHKLAKQYHPDLHPGDKEAEQKFKEVNEAYEVLSDEQKRAKYDRFGHAVWTPTTGQAAREEPGDLAVLSD